MVTVMDLNNQNYYCLQLYCYYHNRCCSAVAVFLLFSIFFFFVTLRPNADHGIFSLEVSTLHITTDHSRYDSSGRAINSSHRPLTTHHIHDKHPCPGEIRNHNLSRRAAAEVCFRQADLLNTTSKFRTVVMFVSREWSKHPIQRLWSMNLFCLHIKFQCFIPHRYNRQLQKMFVRPPSC